MDNHDLLAIGRAGVERAWAIDPLASPRYKLPIVAIDLILFDLDGTLVDTLPDIATSLNQTLGAAGYAPLPSNTIRTLVGEGMRRLVEKALQEQPQGPVLASEAEIQALVDGHNRYYADHVCVYSRVYDGVLELLARLKEHGSYRLAVLSNKPGRLVRPLLSALSLDRFVDAAIGDYDGFPIKPDPASALSLIQRFSTTVHRTLVVGDGIPDHQVAHALGASSVAVTWGFSARSDLEAAMPTAIIDHPLELLRFLRLTPDRTAPATPPPQS